MSQTRAQLVKGFSNTSASADAITVDSSGDVGIGATVPDRLLHLKGASSTAYSGGDDTADYNFLKIENTTDNKSAGVFFLIGSNGEAAITATEVSDGNTDIAFQNRGGGVRSEKMRMLSGGGLTFNGDTAQANALDDYEEGTFTPVFANAASGGSESSSYAEQDGRYTKIGNLVHVDIYLKNVITTSLGTSQFFIRDLPFAVKSGSIYIGTAGLSNVDLNSTASALYAFANATSGAISHFRIFQAKDNTGHGAVPCDAVTSGTNEIFVSMTYPTG